MHAPFDPLSLMVPACFVMAFAALTMLGAYLRKRDETSLLWWSVASMTGASSVAVFIVGNIMAMAVMPIIASLLVILSAAFHLMALRHFNHRSLPIAVFVASLLVLPIAVGLAEIGGLDSLIVSRAASFAVTSGFLYACVWELWSTRGDELSYRRPLAGFLALHALVFTGGLYDVVTGEYISAGAPSLFSWFGMIHFEALAFYAGATTALLTLVRERRANQAIASAGVDALTGTPNRKQFTEKAERLFQRTQMTNAPLSVIMFDLDYFKEVNDTLGHEAGDRVISGFAEILRMLLRPNDLFTRYGGEEFVAVLPNVSAQTAVAIAERARVAFGETFRFVDGFPLRATVSAGVAGADPQTSLEAAIRAADEALYSAKRAGRNSVHCAQAETRAAENVVRIA